MNWTSKLNILFSYLLYRRKYQSRNSLEKVQQKWLKQQLKFVNKHSTFYKEIGHQLSSYPIMNKQSMMKHFDELNTKGLTKEECLKVAISAEKSRDFSPTHKGVTVGLSSGTSGNKGIFLVSEREQYQWVGAILAKVLEGRSIFQKRKVALFLRANSNLYETANEGNIDFHFFDLFSNIDKEVARLSQLNPEIIVAPPSVWIEIIKRCGHSDFENVEQLFSIAEVLPDETKEKVETFFSLPLGQIYQCTEGFLGCTCSHGKLHLNEDIVFVEKEYVDDLRFIPIITDMKRTSQPIIRYRLNDILIEDPEGCSCGNQTLTIKRIEGREDDVFFLLTTNGERQKLFPDLLSRTLLHALPNDIENYRIRQVTHNELVIEVSRDLHDHEKQAIISEFSTLFNQQKVVSPILQFKSFLPLEKGQKLRRVVSEIRP
ncbi:coenzyme F390 synthetase [Bacillus carboniphilus]|uniref:Coenzyme F390 synthetase n=1 Tax=Bacillus carboniphilus TaxID=86663 RepID=A0ABN0W933_9BACI